MKKITYKDQQGNVLAEGVFGESAQEAEGNYYIDRENVDFSHLSKKENAYFCPIKSSQADYYYLKDENGQQGKQEACWIYEEIAVPEFKRIEGKVGFYPHSTSQLTLEETE